MGVAVRPYLEELHANDGKHELQEAGDEDYVSDSLYRYDDALNYVLVLTLTIKQTFFQGTISFLFLFLSKERFFQFD